MRTSVWRILGVGVAAMLTGCAGQSEQLSMQQPADARSVSGVVSVKSFIQS